MDTLSTPPPIPVDKYPTGAYPDPERPIGRAWAAAWAELVTAGAEYVDGVGLAERAAAASKLQQSTMITLLTRAATAGVLERTHKLVDGKRGPRERTHYRIPQP